MKIDLPKVVSALDYHDFDDMECFLNTLTDDKVFVTEIGFNVYDVHYYALMYPQKDKDEYNLDSEKEIREIFERHEIQIDFELDELFDNT